MRLSGETWSVPREGSKGPGEISTPFAAPQGAAVSAVSHPCTVNKTYRTLKNSAFAIDGFLTKEVLVFKLSGMPKWSPLACHDFNDRIQILPSL